MRRKKGTACGAFFTKSGVSTRSSAGGYASRVEVAQFPTDQDH